MPTYEYECGKCGEVFDVLHGMSEDGPKTCLKKGCRGKLKKLISAGSGLIFKGSGFYITDYKKKSGVPESGDGKSDSKAGSSDASGTKGESKGAANGASKNSESKSSGSGSSSSETKSKKKK